MLLLLACGLLIPSANAEYASHRDLERSNLKQTYKEQIETAESAQHFPSQHREAKTPPIFFVEGSYQLPNLYLQHNGFELTCELRFVSA